MALLSIFKRRTEAAGAASIAGTADAVQQARTRARQRLIGAAVLVLIGVIGFPLVFETQPRPIPVDIPIDVPRKEGAPALAMPPARTQHPLNAEPPAAPPAAAAADTATTPSAADAVITESRDDSGRDVTPSPAAPVPVAPVIAPRAASKPPESVTTRPPPAAKPSDEPRPAPSSDGARAQALLDGKPVGKPAEAGRYVVQVGAFADAAAAHDTRTKVEKLGMKTYTQVASTSAGSRIRVRVGPFASREEADKALARARSAGLTAVVLTL